MGKKKITMRNRYSDEMTAYLLYDSSGKRPTHVNVTLRQGHENLGPGCVSGQMHLTSTQARRLARYLDVAASKIDGQKTILKRTY